MSKEATQAVRVEAASKEDVGARAHDWRGGVDADAVRSGCPASDCPPSVPIQMEAELERVQCAVTSQYGVSETTAE